jgi:tryptophan halogenase
MNIVICGGGTAGWLAAYIIHMAQPNIHKITVLESSSIDIIGAGEGSTGTLFDVVSGRVFNLEPDMAAVDDFIQKTNGTKKIGIKHVNWGKLPGSYYAPLDGGITSLKSPDMVFNYILSEYGFDKTYLASHMGQCYENSVFPTGNHAFHFDGRKIGPYFKEKLMTNPNVSFVDGIIKEVKVSSQGNIAKLILDEDRKLEGDFFIDCTGFARVLTSKLGVKWKSYKENLPLDSAIPFIMEYPEEGQVVEPVTIAHALSSGWMWNIPLQNRMGAGYVYSSEFITDEEALKEVSSIVKQDVHPLKQIRFNSGRAEELWKGNCLAIGLSSGFTEPLEATSIHLSIYQSLMFAYEFLNASVEETVTDFNVNFYNKSVGQVHDDYKDFLVLHYQGGRTDSEFWKYNTSGNTITPFVQEILEISKNKLPTTTNYRGSWGSSTQLWSYVLAGLELVNPKNSKKELEMFNLYQTAEDTYNSFKDSYIVDDQIKLELGLQNLNYFLKK